ncbi:MAG: hypothetical protein LBM64_08520 [Deltaproteobacteria bacterium]|jgi:hypothetical protein|nr:hypothetical protein [Deltaproteobacteria bacterium]
MDGNKSLDRIKAYYFFLWECAVKGLAELNRQMFHAVMDGRNMYSELVKE